MDGLSYWRIQMLSFWRRLNWRRGGITYNMAIKADIGAIFRSMNSNWTSRLFSIVVLAFVILALFLYFNRGNSKAITQSYDDCTNQRQQLINALIEVKNSVNEMAAEHTAVEPPSQGTKTYIMAFQDTTKRRKSQQMQRREKLWVISRKIDSVLLMQRKKQNLN